MSLNGGTGIKEDWACMRAPASRYNLGGNYFRFISDIGIDDEVGDKGSVVFQVFGDGMKAVRQRQDDRRLADANRQSSTSPACRR